MLAYSGSGALVVEKLDLSVLVQDMSHLLEISHSKNALVTCEFEERMPAVAGDASQLRQVVMNLITNASEALGGSGSILVQTGCVAACGPELSTPDATPERAEGDFVFLRVTDSGCGMDRVTQERMFEPFFTTKFTGRGLGMAAVRGIVQAHGGTIQVESQVDRGTTVTVQLPALGEYPAPIRDEVRRADDWSSTATVLVVDDEPQIRLLLKRILESRGMKVLTAEDGQQAVETFRQNMDAIACVVLDLTMPHVGGDEAFAQMRQLRADVPAILISGYSEDRLQDSIENLGFAGFIKKPLTAGELLTDVRIVLGL
jgi:CheY-like chemotaxis protein